MTAEERAGIENGIWLCATHARLIDVDHHVYPAEKLRGMKAAHERHIGSQMRDGHGAAQNFTSDLTALRPELLFTGSLVEANHTTWRFQIEHFVLGDLVTLTAICGGAHSRAAGPYDQYFLSNELGDGRTIAAPVSWNGRVLASCSPCRCARQLHASQAPRFWRTSSSTKMAISQASKR